MSKVKIQGNANGTGVFTIKAPGTNDPRTITLPDATGTLLNSDGDGSQLTGISSGADTSLSNLSATGENKVCQAWINFNGTGTVAIRDSYNVSSLTDVGTGDYTVNIDTDMANANYSAVGSAGNTGGENWGSFLQVGEATVGSIGVVVVYSHTNNYDRDNINVAIFGD